MSHTDSTSPINTIIIKIILHTYLFDVTKDKKVSNKRRKNEFSFGFTGEKS